MLERFTILLYDLLSKLMKLAENCSSREWMDNAGLDPGVGLRGLQTPPPFLFPSYYKMKMQFDHAYLAMFDNSCFSSKVV